MFEPVRYLEWARRFYGKVRFDLASSGVPAVAVPEERGLPCPADEGESLRAAIAAYNAVNESEVIAALGTTHALWLACAALTSPGDEVLIEDPAYEPLVRIAEGAGARVARFARPANEGFGVDPQRIADALTPRTRLVVITNLYNPAGTRCGSDVLLAAARAAEARGSVLLVDEVYSPFDALVDARGVFAGSARRVAPNIVAASSLTKCYGLGADRIGWLLGPPPLVARARDALTASLGILPLCHARVGRAAFAGIQGLAERARAVVVSNKRERVAAWALEHGFGWSAPREGLFGLVTVPDRGDLTSIIEGAVATHEVLVAAGAFFGVPNGFRVAWSEPAEKLEEGLGRLAEVLSRHR
jgi:aspartate/methionine/tyrosine aminotransferase